jgi:hypothetical protein
VNKGNATVIHNTAHYKEAMALLENSVYKKLVKDPTQCVEWILSRDPASQKMAVNCSHMDQGHPDYMCCVRYTQYKYP